jgi:MFS family permease
MSRPRPPLSHAFRALQLPNYRRYWLGQLASQSGTWMQSLAQAWLVLRLTDSPLALGTVVTMQFSPILLFSLFGGVLADHLPKRRLLIGAQVVMLVQAALLAVLTWTGLVQLWHIYVLAAVLGTATALERPTRQAFVHDLVGGEDLANAVALNSAQFNLSRIFGPAVAGVLITIVGEAGCFSLNALSYLFVIIALLRIDVEGHAAPDRQRGRVLSQIGQGLRYSLTTPDTALVFMVIGVIGTFGYNFTVILPLIARYVLEIGAIGFGGMTTAMGIGSLGAALGIAYLGKASRRTLLIGAGGFSLLLAAVGLSPWLPLTLGLLAVLGLCSITFSTTANTRLQLVAPPEMRGRV